MTATITFDPTHETGRYPLVVSQNRLRRWGACSDARDALRELFPTYSAGDVPWTVESAWRIYRHNRGMVFWSLIPLTRAQRAALVRDGLEALRLLVLAGLARTTDNTLEGVRDVLSDSTYWLSHEGWQRLDHLNRVNSGPVSNLAYLLSRISSRVDDTGDLTTASWTTIHDICDDLMEAANTLDTCLPDCPDKAEQRLGDYLFAYIRDAGYQRVSAHYS